MTGLTKGIGHAIAVALVAEGAHVIVNGCTEVSVGDAIACLCTEVSDAQVEGFAGDLSNPAQADALFDRFPKADILINNLGIFGPKPLEEIDDAEWRHLLNANMLSGVWLSRTYLPGMHVQNWGRTMFISSESGVQIPVETVHYGVTETTLLSPLYGSAELTVSTAITADVVLPGPTRPEGVSALVGKPSGGQSFEVFEKTLFETTRLTSLIKRFATMQEVANLVVYVTSPLLSATTGVALRVDGGVAKSTFQNADPDERITLARDPGFYAGRVAGVCQRDSSVACLFARIIENVNQADRTCPRPYVGGIPSTSSEWSPCPTAEPTESDPITV